MYWVLVILAAIGVMFAASAAIVALVRSIGGELGNAGKKAVNLDRRDRGQTAAKAHGGR